MDTLKDVLSAILPRKVKQMTIALLTAAGSVTTRLRSRRHWRSFRRLEIGSGTAKRPGWLTLDAILGADVVWDLRWRLPFPDDTFEVIYSSHVLEHFCYSDLRRLLSELLRILRPGGTMLICVPDAALYVAAYNSRQEADDLLRYRPAVISNLPMDALNYIFYMDGQHRMMFDAESLRYHCEKAGFRDFSMRDFDPSVDSTDRQYESLYAICHKNLAAS